MWRSNVKHVTLSSWGYNELYCVWWCHSVTVSQCHIFYLESGPPPPAPHLISCWLTGNKDTPWYARYLHSVSPVISFKILHRSNWLSCLHKNVSYLLAIPPPLLHLYLEIIDGRQIAKCQYLIETCESWENYNTDENSCIFVLFDKKNHSFLKIICLHYSYT